MRWFRTKFSEKFLKRFEKELDSPRSVISPRVILWIGAPAPCRVKGFILGHVTPSMPGLMEALFIMVPVAQSTSAHYRGFPASIAEAKPTSGMSSNSYRPSHGILSKSLSRYVNHLKIPIAGLDRTRSHAQDV